MTNRDYKENARMALRGYYMPFVLARLIFFLSTTFIATLSGNIYTAGLARGISGSYIARTAFFSGSVIFGLAIDLLIMLLGFIFTFGYIRMGMRRNRGENINIVMVFDGFKPGSGPWKLVGISAMLSLISFGIMLIPITMIFAGSFVFAITGRAEQLIMTGTTLIVLLSFLVAYLNLSLAFSAFIIIDHPEMGMIAAMKKSFHMMRGRRLRLLGLVLFGFFGWHILNLFSMGLLSIWLEPYILSSVIQFYMDANGEISGGRRSYYEAYTNVSREQPDHTGESGETEALQLVCEAPDEVEYTGDAEAEEHKDNEAEQTDPDTIRLNGEVVVREPEESSCPDEAVEKKQESRSFEELMEELYKENKLKNDNYFGKGDRS